MEINNHKPYSRCRVWRCDVTASNSIQDGGALVVNILVFELRVQLQHCTYQRKTLLFALIKVSTFICEREISGLSSPLTIDSFDSAKDSYRQFRTLWVQGRYKYFKNIDRNPSFADQFNTIPVGRYPLH